MADHTHADYADGFDDGKELVLGTVRLAVKLLDEAARLRDVGDIGARVLENRVRELLRNVDGVSLPPHEGASQKSSMPADGEER